jgi:hypothetical protein
MQAKKTLHRSLVLRRIADLNDQFDYLQFVEEQFTSTFAPLPEDDRFTTDVFPDNRHAARIHVPVRNLPDFAAATRRVTNGAFFAAAVESVDEYLNRLSTTLQAEDRPNEGAEIRLSESVHKLGGQLNSVVTDTLTFSRLRRNRFIHSGKPGEGLKRLVRDRGKQLSAFWNMKAIDFSGIPPVHLTEPEVIEYFALLRRCIEAVDRAAAGVLDADRLLHELWGGLRNRQRHLRGPGHRERFARKLSRAAAVAFGMTVSAVDCEKWIGEQED